MKKAYVVTQEWYEIQGLITQHGEDILKVFTSEKKAINYIIEFCKTAIEDEDVEEDKIHYIKDIPSVEQIKKDRGIKYYAKGDTEGIGLYYYQCEVG